MTTYGKEIQQQLPGLSINTSNGSHLTVIIQGWCNREQAYLTPKEVKALTVEMIEWLESSHLTLGDMVQEEPDGGLPF